MSYVVLQVGNTLQFMDSLGNLTQLSLPSNISLSTSVPPRFETFLTYVVLVNTPTKPITIDATGTVRPLCPAPPPLAPLVAAGDAGGLTGTYSGIRYSYIIKDAVGNDIAVSDYSPPSGSVTVSAEKIRVSGLVPSADFTTGFRIYRPTNGGAINFPWFDIDSPNITSAEDDTADASLSQVAAAPNLGTPPVLYLIKQWQSLLWGVGGTTPNTLQYSTPALQYDWDPTNTIDIPPGPQDTTGIVSLMPRRDSLGVARKNIMWHITGQNTTNFQRVMLSNNVGVESNESVVVYKDTVWWLWKDGVYQWDTNGINNISDTSSGGGVRSWFTTDNYFNRNMFQYSFAVFDPIRYKYRLFLASAGSLTINQWVEYDVQTQTWWGPHSTQAFGLQSAFTFVDAHDKEEAVWGDTTGFVWAEQPLAADGTFGIATNLTTKFFSGDISAQEQFQGAPSSLSDLEKYWGQLSVLGKAQPSGQIIITPTTGYMGSAAGTPFNYNMTLGRQRLQRLGNGKVLQLNFQHSKANEPVELYGFIIPWHILGRR